MSVGIAGVYGLDFFSPKKKYVYFVLAKKGLVQYICKIMIPTKLTKGLVGKGDDEILIAFLAQD